MIIMYSGKDGYYNDMGNYEYCQDIDKAHLCTITLNVIPVISWALCVPISCSPGVFEETLNIHFKEDIAVEYHCGENKYPTDPAGITIFYLFICILLICISYGTYIDYYQEEKLLNLKVPNYLLYKEVYVHH